MDGPVSLRIKHWLYVSNQVKYPRVLTVWLFAAPSSCVQSRTNSWGLISGDSKAISEAEIIITLILFNILTSRLYLPIAQRRRPIAWISLTGARFEFAHEPLKLEMKSRITDDEQSVCGAGQMRFCQKTAGSRFDRNFAWILIKRW